ncbi:helix-turn-helix domain-containing protein [Methyloceanibacter sp.]|uniref:helix-turn-helix domain-containing protein n=1 Tax=Methyloceanibacter sp. TaxID=1965321 RepID=UPI002CB79413|nr:helix-turn-helix transcriptional regulator [Methyloceanibacter sp.]
MSVALAEARMTQTELAAKTGRSTAYVNQLITGHKKPSPEWVELIADTLKLSPEQRRDLHVAAARQHGFKLDLTKK